MIMVGYRPYEPQSTPISWAENIWTVNGSVVDYHVGGLAIPCPTRMTIIRLQDDSLWLHSPTAYSSELDEAVQRLGDVSAIISPNNQHYLNVNPWAHAHPRAKIYATLGRAENLGADFSFRHQDSPIRFWNGEIDYMLVELGKYDEAIFFHQSSRTLIVTDLMQNFESDRVRSPVTRMILKMARALGPNASPSIEIWKAAARNRHGVERAFEQMLVWDPTSIILAHGKCLTVDIEAEIRRAFKFVENLR